jgi:aerobic carbon-monoxide dehydrogenase medium subunit
MKPPPFDYVAPRSIDEAVAALANGGPDAKVLAGGQSLIPLLNFRLARPGLLVDLNRIAELAHVTPRDGGVAIGAMTRQASIERHQWLAQSQPLLNDAIRWVGHPAIRSRGTLGGSLAHADPAAELPAVAVCLDARLSVIGPHGYRSIAAEDFFVGYLTTVLAPEEILVETWLPGLAPATGQAWLEFARRHGDFALAGVAVSVAEHQERVQAARIVLSGVGGKPVRAREAENLLIGGSVRERVSAAADAVRSAIDPEPDIHASKEYRTQLACVLTERAILQAHERALANAPAALDVRRTLETMSRYG